MNRFHPSQWNRKFFGVVAALLAAINLMGPNGFIHWVLLKQEARRLTVRESGLTQELAQTRSEIRHFRSSKIARERSIRGELGYLKPDESSVEIAP